MYSFASGTILSAATCSPSIPGTHPVSLNISLASSRRAIQSLVITLLMIYLSGVGDRGSCDLRSPNGRLWNIRWPADHSGLAPENLTTLPHFSVSSAMSLPKSATEPGSTMPPRSANRAFNLGSASPALISLLSFVLLGGAENDQEFQTRMAAFREE